jgi:hypothetical protein
MLLLMATRHIEFGKASFASSDPRLSWILAQCHIKLQHVMRILVALTQQSRRDIARNWVCSYRTFSLILCVTVGSMIQVTRPGRCCAINHLSAS